MVFNVKKTVFYISRKLNIINLISTYKFSISHSPLIHYWDYKKNWGDSINKFLFESILGKEIFVSNQVFNFKNQEKITGVGSILNSHLDNYSIWGSGFLSENHSLIQKPNNVLALRGKYTSKKIKGLFNLDCEVLGDPGLLFKEFYNPDLPKKYSVGIIPHFKELDLQILFEIRKKYGEDVPIISPCLDIFEFANQVKQCEKILSSSLHGLILAESYGIPTARVILSDRLIGGDFKFEDYYSGVNIDFKWSGGVFIQSVNDIFNSIKLCSLKDLDFSEKKLKDNLLNHIS